MEGYKRVLQQDDCAPDSLEYFRKEFEEKFGISYTEWYSSADPIDFNDNHYTIGVKKDNLIVMCDAGSPWWEVWEKEPQG